MPNEPRPSRPLWAFAATYALLGALTALLWAHVAPGAAVALGVGIMEIGPLRRQRSTAVAAWATALAGVAIVVAGVVGDGAGRYALVTAVAALAAGVSARWGLYSAVVVAPIALVVVSTPAAADVAAPRAIALVVGGLIGIGVVALWHNDPPVEEVVLPLGWAVATGLVLAGLTGGALWVTASHRITHGHWVAATVLAVAVPSAVATLDRSAARTAATVAGAAGASLFAWSVPWAGVVTGLALLAALWSVTHARGYEARIAAVTVAVVLYAGGGDTGASAALARVAATLVGAGLVAVAVVAVWLLTRLIDPEVELE
jgi:hypothetical protein